MTSRERVLSVLKGNKPDRIPWIPLCSGTYFASLPDYNKKWGWHSIEALKFRINFYGQEIGADYRQWGGVTPYRVKRSSSIQIRSKRKGNQIFREIQTPVGTLTAQWVYSERAHTFFPRKDYLETVEDMKIWQYVLEDEVYEANYEPLVEQLKELGEEGVFFLDVPYGTPAHNLKAVSEVIQEYGNYPLH